jgi:hypothetical protein
MVLFLVTKPAMEMLSLGEHRRPEIDEGIVRGNT